jgi:hypothetical protein
MNILLQTPPQPLQPVTQPVVQIPIQPKVTKTLVKNVIQVKSDSK